MADTEIRNDVAALTVQLLSAYLANNSVALEDLASLIRTTRAALVEDTFAAVVESDIPAYAPAVSVRKSLASPDHIISLIDGKPYKTLKRHLSANGLTPEEYRKRYGLPASYPMVSPSFTARRREIAERIGLGSRRAVPADPAVQSDEIPGHISAGVNDDAPAKAPRGRPVGKRGSVKESGAATGAAKARGRKPRGSADAHASVAVPKVNPAELTGKPTAEPEAEVTMAEASREDAKASKQLAKGKKPAGKAAAKGKVVAKPSADTPPKAAEPLTGAVGADNAPAAALKRSGKLGQSGEPSEQGRTPNPTKGLANISTESDVTDRASDAAVTRLASAKKPVAKKRMARARKSTPAESSANVVGSE